jgi:HK97 gp10 family phage protein
MQVEFKVKQSEIDKVLREVSKYGERVSDLIDRETAYAAFEVERLAKEEVPVDKGILKNSINNIRVGGFKGVRSMVSKITYLIGSNVVYSRYIEFGTPVGTGPNGGPRPFLRPAFRDVIPGYIRAIQKLMRSVR